MIIGIAGGIGAGKSVVSRILRCRGFEVYDCDYEAKLLMDASLEIKNAIALRMGNESILYDGSLNRPHIASRVFSDEVQRNWLNELVHSMVHEDIKVRVALADCSLFFVESAIFKTSGLDRICDEIWIVDAPLELRIKRAMQRDSSDAARIMERINAQRGELEELDARVRLIDNGDSVALLPQIDLLLIDSGWKPG